MTLAAKITGNDDAPALVLLHAIATSHAMWDPQISVLSERFKVVALDLPGHGGSAPLGAGAGIGDYADAVASKLNALGVDRAAFIGLSLGSMIAQRLAIDHPTLAQATVLANGVGFVPEAVCLAWRERIAAVEVNGMIGQVEPTLHRWFTPNFIASAPLTVDWIGRLVAATSPAGYIGAAVAICGLDHREGLSRIVCPTLVISGAHDTAAPCEAVAALAEAIPVARHVVLPAAHLTNVELAMSFTALVHSFLAEVAF